MLPPIYLDDTGAAYNLLVIRSGGLVGGDRLSMDMSVKEGAHVLISAPSANRVYRSEGEVSAQYVTLAVGPGAILEWLPEQTIPFAGSRFRQTLHATLAPGATILLWDAIAAGRIARGERWAFATLENDIRNTTASGASLLERYALDPSTTMGSIGLASDWDYVASLYVVSDAVTPEAWNRLETRIGVTLDEQAEIQTGVPNLQLLTGAQDLLNAADAKSVQKRRLLRSIKSLESDYILVDLGGGNTLSVLDFFLMSDGGILVVTPEPTSIENTYRFLKSAFYRRLRQTVSSSSAKGLIDEALDGKNEAGIRTPYNY